MCTGQFVEGHGDSPVDEGRGNKTKNGGGARDFHGGAGPEQKSGANGSADGHHGHLPGGELVVKPFFVGENLVGENLVGENLSAGNLLELWRRGLRRHAARYQKEMGSPRFGESDWGNQLSGD
jgi:hypothetical protein